MNTTDENILDLVYKDLRRLAKHYLAAERRNHTLQATALVHEAYLRINQHTDFHWKSRSHFFAVAARTMRRVLVDHARKIKAVKRDGMKLTFESALYCAAEQPAALLALDEALERLVQVNARQARIVELKFFGGLSVEEIAGMLGISERTIKRDWNSALTWLKGQLKHDAGTRGHSAS